MSPPAVAPHTSAASQHRVGLDGGTAAALGRRDRRGRQQLGNGSSRDAAGSTEAYRRTTTAIG
jgi:hypothetical protein